MVIVVDISAVVIHISQVQRLCKSCLHLKMGERWEAQVKDVIEVEMMLEKVERNIGE